MAFQEKTESELNSELPETIVQCYQKTQSCDDEDAGAASGHVHRGRPAHVVAASPNSNAYPVDSCRRTAHDCIVSSNALIRYLKYS